MQNRLTLILGILCALFFLSTVKSCSDAYRLKVARDKEMLSRMDAEEKITKFNEGKTELEKRVNDLAKQLEQEKAAHNEVKKALAEEQLVDQSLKDELLKVTKVKDALEQDLKNALANKSTKAKR